MDGGAPLGCDLMESSPLTDCIRSRMLMSPRPRRWMASCASKPTPRSLTVSSISPPVPCNSTLKCRTPLCFTAFCKVSCKTRNRQSEISLGTLLGMAVWLKSISTSSHFRNRSRKLPRANIGYARSSIHPHVCVPAT